MRRVGRFDGRPPIASTVIDLDAGERALRRQRRLAIRTVSLLGVTLAVLMITAILVDGHLGWAILFFAPYPLLLTLAFFHVRHAERIETDS